MLAKVEEVKSRLNIDYDDDTELLKAITEEVDSIIKNYLGRDIEKEDVVKEYHESDGSTREFLLKHYPIASGDTFTAYWEDEEIDSDEYEVYWDEGAVLFLSDKSSARKKLNFSYSGGFATVPSALKSAFINMCGALYNERKGSGIRSESLGDYSVTYTSEKGLGGGIIDEFKDVLDLYKRRDY